MSSIAAVVDCEADLLAIKRCKIYLRVYFLSDILIGDGACIKKESWQGISNASHPKATSWLLQSLLPNRGWTV
jgi:hypothetical protein